MNLNNSHSLFILSETFTLRKLNRAIRSSKTDYATVLVFNDDIELLKKSKHALSQKYQNIEFIYAAGELESLAYSVRKTFIKLIAGAKDIKVDKGEKLNNYLKYEKNFSMWWLNEIFHKRSYKFKTFTYLCQIEFIDKYIHNINNIRECYIFSSDNKFKKVMFEVMGKKNITINNISFTLFFEFQYLNSIFQFLKFSLIFIKWFFSYLMITIMCKLFINQKIYQNKIAFIQFYTAFWPKNNFFRDDKFGKNNKIIHSFEDDEVISICTLFPDGIHTSIKPLDIFRILKEKKIKYYDNEKVFLLEKYITFKKIFLLFFYSFKLIYILAKLARSNNFKNYWIYKDINIYPFIKTELHQSLRRTPRYLYYVERLKEFGKIFKPKAIIYNMFEAPIGKCTVYALKSSLNNVNVIGTQDGPLCRLKLETASHPSEFSKLNLGYNFLDFMPIPDQILLEGEYARSVLNESGYPSKILNVCGSSRMLGLSDYNVNRLRNGKQKILIAFGGNDNYPIINILLEILKMNKNYYFIFKNHPRGIMNSEVLNTYLIKLGFTEDYYEISNKTPWELFEECNFVVGTFTSVLDEAAVKGLKVISLLFASRINTSILMDLNLQWVKSASSALEVCNIIDKDDFSMPNQEELAKIEKHLYNYTSIENVNSWRDKIYKIIG